MNKLILTITGIIALATSINLGFSSSAHAQLERTEEPEIFQEEDTNTINNDVIDSQRARENYWRIMNPSYPDRIQQNRNYPTNYDENRSQRQRNYYERLMEPYHPRYDSSRNSSSSNRIRRDYSRSRYDSYRGRDYIYNYRNR